MSLASSPDYMFRPEDQALKMLFPNVTENASSFDEFFNEEMYKLDARSEDSSEHLPGIEPLFRHETAIEDDFRLPSFSDSPKLDLSPIQPWREGVWCLKQTQQHAPLLVEKTRRAGTKIPDPIQTMNFSTYNYRDSQSPLETPQLYQTKRFTTSPISTSLHTNLTRPPFSREATLSPTPMYAQLSMSPKHGQGDVSTWQQDFQNFHLRHAHEQIHQPPLASPPRETRHGGMARNTNKMITAQTNSIEVTSPSYEHAAMASTYHLNAIDPVLLDPVQSPQDDYQCLHSHRSLISQSPPALHRRNSVHSPPSDSLPSSSSSNHSRGTTTQTANTSISIHSQAFLSPTTVESHPPLPTLAPEEVYPVLVAPKPQRLTHGLLQNQSHHPTGEAALIGAMTDGYSEFKPKLQQQMMIQSGLYNSQTYDHLVSHGISAALPHTAQFHPPLPSGTTSLAGSTHYSNPITCYPPLPAASAYLFPDGSPFTPRKQRRSPTRSPSPPYSPTANITISPRRNPHRSPTRVLTDYSHSRRKSIHKYGPIKGTAPNCLYTQQDPPPLPTSTSTARLQSQSQSQRQRARSHSRPPRTPKTPKMPKTSSFGGGNNHNDGTSGSMMVDFVNFTPKDSAKLLSDVAPSGSSKTRARREMEAREKRKKLSEAALKAVRVAGGDVSVFEKAIVMA